MAPMRSAQVRRPGPAQSSPVRSTNERISICFPFGRFLEPDTVVFDSFVQFYSCRGRDFPPSSSDFVNPALYSSDNLTCSCCIIILSMYRWIGWLLFLRTFDYIHEE